MTLSNYINPIYLNSDKMKEMKSVMYGEKYVKALIFDNFLKKELADELYNELLHNKGIPTYEGVYDPKAHGFLGYNHYRGEVFDKVKQLYNDEMFFRFLSFFFNKKAVIGRTKKKSAGILADGLIVQSNREGNYMTWHEDGDGVNFLGNSILYIGLNWKPENAGLLQLGYREDNEIICYREIEPLFNRFVFFLGEKDKSRHKFSEIKGDFLREAIIQDITHYNSIKNLR